ncbi:type II toxin-antitoxin system RelB/DinJ family antitoxin [uncultured Tyzzerella sp.]|uniref:type II toxin-antitoxin system RelB/DinJ family antitoxin n=1 Tax=uncultured Tyzzerella sp. TaxID=2321398 RepID=UPI00294390AC|nr:type II toxin-antitoxin system RelB/DinJ family antitoxin [uncultured Tyzzerella sp.]
MAQTNINIRMDENLKKQFELFCNELGLTMTTAFNIFAKTVVIQQKIPFELSLNTNNIETLEAIEEVKQLKNNPNKKVYSSFGELLKEVEEDV